MKYKGHVFGADVEISIEKDGLIMGGRFLDYSEVKTLKPVNHRILIDTISAEEIEISMLGFSYDGFWEELMDCFGRRSLEALFVDEEQIMLCEGEYTISKESGRGRIALYPDAICVLPQTHNAIRIPLCFADRIYLDGYMLHIIMQTGEEYVIGKMGYNTKPFAERAEKVTIAVKKQRAQALEQTLINAPFTKKGLFRTKCPEQYWNAAFGKGVCAVELYTGEDAATYLYRFDEGFEDFFSELEKAMEEMGTHREIIYMTDEQLKENPLYLMALHRKAAVRYLRKRSNGRLIHGKNHLERLEKYLTTGQL